jgi:hypothetical protein
MGPAVVLLGLLALSLVALGVTMRQTAPASRTQVPPFRLAVPWIAGGMIAAAVVLVALPGVAPVVTAGLTVYTGVAVAALWRLASLDRRSRWMLPSERRARVGISVVALTWLGVILGLMLRLADLVASAPPGP